jgi:N-acyl-phosphatidylethanolamine-hydrolysing phospholipase D
MLDAACVCGLTFGAGLKPWFISSGIPSERVTELDWYHESLLHFPSSSQSPYSDNPAISRHPPAPVIPNSESDEASSDSDLTLKVAFTPAQHRSGRGLLDHMTTLWGSWCVGVVEKEDEGRARDLGMKGWKGFNVFFGG